jgi:dipeptidyl-peptidase-4
MSHLAALTALSFVAAATPPAEPPADRPDPTFLRSFAETRGFLLGRPTRITPTPDGDAVLFLRSPPRQPTLALFEYTVATGQTRELVTPAQLLKGAEERLSVAEKARRERMRIVDRGFTSFQLSEDGRTVLLPLSGRVFLYDRAGDHLGRIRAQPAQPAAPAVIDPRLAPDGTHLAYVREQDLFVADAAGLAAGSERRLTRGGTEKVTHGLAEFVAQEEMDRFEGYFWSPDSRFLAYAEVDQSDVERFTIADPAHPEQPPTLFPYPRAGKANARVRLGIVPAAGGKTVWARWDAERYPYLARVIWKEKKAPLTLLVQTRDQREQALLAVDARTGTSRVLLVEKDDAWVELDRELPRWLPDGSGFLWPSEREGARALELHRPDGALERVVLPAGRGFLSLVHVAEDAQRAAVLTATPTTTTLVEVSLRAAAPPRPLTTDRAEHAAVFAKNGAVYIDSRTAADALPGAVVYRRDGEAWTRVGPLPDVADAPPFRVRLELTEVRAAGSDRSYAAAVVRPRAFDPRRKYPVLVNVYGGPSSLTVRSDQRSYLLQQWIADHGALVVSIDNRGTARKDRAWSRAIKGSFGRIPLDDQVEGLRALGARYPELDLGRVGIYGWSFGGYMSALAVMRRPDVFRAGVAGAPVVDWQDYDTHYTERYLDLPPANAAGYAESSLLTYAGRLSRPLLVIHGTGDDNVYFFHSLKLADALFRAGRPFEFLPLSVTHQVPEAVVRERLWGRVVEFLLSRLR